MAAPATAQATKIANDDKVYYRWLQTAQTVFLLETQGNGDGAFARFTQAVKDLGLVEMYVRICTKMGVPTDNALVAELREKNARIETELDAAVANAVENHGEDEVREAHLQRASHLVLTGDKTRGLAALDTTLEKTVGLGQKLDIVFTQIRVGLFFDDPTLIRAKIDKAKQLLLEVGDWERRNRLKVYEALFSVTIREFKKAALLFLDSISTFTATELMTYNEFIGYTVLTAVVSLDRVTIRDKVVKAPEILSVIRELPDMFEWVSSFYNCNYREYFERLGRISERVKQDRYLAAHSRYFTREARVVAYTQFLVSYKSVTMASMAAAFGVTVPFVDQEISRFIAAGRLSCKIDAFHQIIETNRPDSKNAQYEEVIRQGDSLLNRVQKLSRVISL